MKRGNSANAMVFAAAVALVSSSVLAVTRTWNPVLSQDWGTDSCWDFSGVPGVPATGDVAQFLTASNTINLNVNSAELGGICVVGANPTISSSKYYLAFANGATIDVSAGNILTVDAKISLANTSTLTKTGGGTLQLTPVSGSYDFYGTLNINGGDVNLSDRSLHAPTHVKSININVDDVGYQGTLSGNGLIGSNGNASVVVGGYGEITPYDRVSGALAGTMDINGTLTLKEGSEYHAYIGDPSTGSLINVMSLSQLGVTRIDVTGLAGFDPSVSASWPILVSTGLNAIDVSKFVIGTVDGDATGVPSGYFSVWSAAGGCGSTVLYLQYAAVPEAGTVLLGGCAVMPLLAYRRRAKRA